MKTCQACGESIYNEKDMGHNADGSLNGDFCKGCFRAGRFTQHAAPPETSMPIPAIGALWPNALMASEMFPIENNGEYTGD